MARHKSKIFKPHNPGQTTLLENNLLDLIPKGHICFLINDVIDRMDLSPIYAKYKSGGTSSYSPKFLLKAWCLGFVNRIYSSRQLAKAIRENITFMWISGRTKPTHVTLNSFRLKLEEDIKIIFKQIVKEGIRLGLIDGRDIFIDHSKNEADANKHKMIWRKNVDRQLVKIDEELELLFEHVKKINEEEDKKYQRKDISEIENNKYNIEKIEKLVESVNNQYKEGKKTSSQIKEDKTKLRRTKELLIRKEKYSKQKKILNGRNSYSKTDQDAIAMRMKDKITTKPAYNVGIVVESGFIVNYDVNDKASDPVGFIPLMEGAIENLGKAPKTCTTDQAYGTEENHDYLEKKDIENYAKYNTYHREKSLTWLNKKIRLADFHYDLEKDLFTCPEGAFLEKKENRVEETTTGYKRDVCVYSTKEGRCKFCSMKYKCTQCETKTINLSWKGERLKAQAKKNLDSEKGKELRRRRANEAESPFGDGHHNKKKKRYLLRGLKKVNIESGLLYLAHNLCKINKSITKKTEHEWIESNYIKAS